MYLFLVTILFLFTHVTAESRNLVFAQTLRQPGFGEIREEATTQPPLPPGGQAPLSTPPPSGQHDSLPRSLLEPIPETQSPPLRDECEFGNFRPCTQEECPGKEWCTFEKKWSGECQNVVCPSPLSSTQDLPNQSLLDSLTQNVIETLRDFPTRLTRVITNAGNFLVQTAVTAAQSVANFTSTQFGRITTAIFGTVNPVDDYIGWFSVTGDGARTSSPNRGGKSGHFEIIDNFIYALGQNGAVYKWSKSITDSNPLSGSWEEPVTGGDGTDVFKKGPDGKFYVMGGNGAVHRWESPQSSATGNINTTGGGGTTYQASADFSGTQGSPKPWYYVDSTTFQQLTYNGNNPNAGNQPAWQGLEQYLLIGNNWQSPGQDLDAVRRWVAPGGGTIRITGNVHDNDSRCGDGIIARIRQNGIDFWSATIANGNTAGEDVDRAITVANQDKIDFVVNKGLGFANNWCDATFFDPKIEFTPSSDPAAGKVTVRKTFLPGVSGTVTLLLDGIAPNTETSKESIWNTVATGSHTLTAQGTVPKTFYAVCPNATNCRRPIREGEAITFSHQYGQNDAVRLFFADAGSRLSTDEGVWLSHGRIGAGINGVNMDIDESIDGSCELTFETNIPQADEKYALLLKEVADEWSKSYVKVKIVSTPEAITAPVPVTGKDLVDRVGVDARSVLKLGDFHIFNDIPSLQFCPGGRGLLGLANATGIVNGSLTALYFTSPDIVVDTANPYIIGLVDPAAYKEVVRPVSAHEVGHGLGLGHINNQNSVMFIPPPCQFISNGVIVSALTQLPTASDIEAVNGLYPHCAPLSKNFSISFAPDPAVWQDTSPPVGVCGPNGNLIVHNRKWSTRLTIQAPSSGDITITDRRLNVFDASGLRTTLRNDRRLNWQYRKDSNTSQSYFIYPFGFLPTRAELTLSGTDDRGNPVTSTASVNLEQGNYYHISANCTTKETGNSVPSIWAAFGSSCDPSRCE